jgi:hypothetical protein
MTPIFSAALGACALVACGPHPNGQGPSGQSGASGPSADIAPVADPYVDLRTPPCTAQPADCPAISSAPRSIVGTWQTATAACGQATETFAADGSFTLDCGGPSRDPSICDLYSGGSYQDSYYVGADVLLEGPIRAVGAHSGIVGEWWAAVSPYGMPNGPPRYVFTACGDYIAYSLGYHTPRIAQTSVVITEVGTYSLVDANGDEKVYQLVCADLTENECPPNGGCIFHHPGCAGLAPKQIRLLENSAIDDGSGCPRTRVQ